ncbi:MAG: 50S ribosomal protein L9 [Gammaproteobacteria bacterium]|nr:50S ribosomal protein L9 [Gammaproteobacteria bacterium]
MKVILQERVANLGNVGDCVNVKAGYARNLLLPRGKAVQATASNVLAFEKRRSELEKIAAEVFAAAQQRAASFEGHVVSLAAAASEEGKLFGSVGPRDIAKAVTDSGKALEKSEVEMPEGPIRALGEYTITVHLHGEVQAKIKVVVTEAK